MTTDTIEQTTTSGLTTISFKDEVTIVTTSMETTLAETTHTVSTLTSSVESSEETIIYSYTSSELSSESTNFFKADYTTILTEARIDTSVSHTNPKELKKIP